MVERTASLDDLRTTLRRLLPLLSERYGVKSLAIFGSYVRGEQRPDSDLDLLVSFDSAPGLFKFIELEHFLGDELGIRVDLVMKESLKPRIGRRILSETVSV